MNPKQIMVSFVYLFNIIIAGNSCQVSPVHPQQSLLPWSSERISSFGSNTAGKPLKHQNSSDTLQECRLLRTCLRMLQI